MTPLEKMIEKMLRRASQGVPDGTPIIPDGPRATSEDIGEFQRRCGLMRYEVFFGAAAAVTITHGEERFVNLTAHCSVGTLTDEFLHVWNNTDGRRGRFLPTVEQGQQHRASMAQRVRSGSNTDRIFHQFEIANFAYCVRAGEESIPSFIWRTFRAL